MTLTPDEIQAMIDAVPDREWDGYGPAEAYHRAVRDMEARFRQIGVAEAQIIERDAALRQIARDVRREFGFDASPP